MTKEAILPTHVGLILDGNRRWAKEQGLPTLKGHSRGVGSFHDVARHAFDRGVKYVSAFAFSTENWSRTEEEVSYLMGLIVRALERYLDELHEEGIKIVFLGRRNGMRAKVLAAFERAEEKTCKNTKGTLAFCVNYGGQEEIVDAVKTIVASGVSPDEITRQTIADALYAPEVPGVDLMIRTSGEKRTSGFMMYRSDYAELYFCDKYWPEFAPADLDDALAEFAHRKRRFGK